MSTPSLPSPPAHALAALLPPEVDLADPPRHEASRPVWLGMVWSRLGRADLAWQFWDRVGADVVQAWLAAERGRVLREFGLHTDAERIEWPALARADDPVDRVMLQVSLTADAVGRGDRDTAIRRLDNAQLAIEGLADGPRAARQRLRLSWVRTEVAWLVGEAPDGHGLPLDVPASDAALVAQVPDLQHGTEFHRAKALLFGGLVARDLSLLDAAARGAPAMLAWAVHLARADLGAPGAEEAARAAWRAVRPPERVRDLVAATPTARRLAAAPGAKRPVT